MQENPEIPSGLLSRRQVLLGLATLPFLPACSTVPDQPPAKITVRNGPALGAANERSEYSPEIYTEAARNVVAFRAIDREGRRRLLSGGVLLQRAGLPAHSLLTCRHLLGSQNARGHFSDTSSKNELVMLPAAAQQSELIGGLRAFDAGAKNKGRVRPESLVFSDDDTLDAMAVPLAAICGWQEFQEILRGKPMLKFDLNPPRQGEQIFVLTPELPVRQLSPKAEAVCGYRGKILQNVYDSKMQAAGKFTAKDADALNEGIEELCHPTEYTLRRSNGWIGDANLIRKHGRREPREGEVVVAVESLPGHSGLPVFSVRDGELRFRGLLVEGLSQAGGFAVMLESRTIWEKLVVPKQAEIERKLQGVGYSKSCEGKR